MLSKHSFFQQTIINLYRLNLKIALKKVVLVTGATMGIGRGVAKYLYEKGYRVYGLGRKAKSGEKLDGFELLQGDINSETSIKDALKTIVDKCGHIDVVVNNAGVAIAGPVENSSIEESKKIYDTNVFGTLNVCKQVITYMRDNGGGNIINITSMGGIIGLPFRGIYCSSKYAVEGLSEILSMEVAQFGIKVSIMEPTDFKSSINENRTYSSERNTELYDTQFKNTQIIMNKEVEEGFEPEVMGKKIYQVLQKKNPRLRYRVTNFLPILTLTLRKTLPSRFFEKLLFDYYSK